MMGQTINLEAAVASFYQPLYRFAYSLTRNEAAALDLTQQTFLILTRHVHQIKAQDKLKSWLFTTLRREFLRLVRHQNSHPEVEFQPGQHDVPSTANAEVTAVDAHTILEALDQVDETYRITLKLFYLGELSYREIADTLGIPVGTVMSRLSRGKDQLRARLGELQTRADPKIIPLDERKRRNHG